MPSISFTWNQILLVIIRVLLLDKAWVTQVIFFGSRTLSLVLAFLGQNKCYIAIQQSTKISDVYYGRIIASCLLLLTWISLHVGMIKLPRQALILQMTKLDFTSEVDASPFHWFPVRTAQLITSGDLITPPPEKMQIHTFWCSGGLTL